MIPYSNIITNQQEIYQLHAVLLRDLAFTPSQFKQNLLLAMQKEQVKSEIKDRIQQKLYIELQNRQQEDHGSSLHLGPSKLSARVQLCAKIPATPIDEKIRLAPT